MSETEIVTAPVETPPEIPLGEALAQWQCEARHGEWKERYRCRYFVWGDGPPLVFIHGLCDRARSFVPVMAPLCKHFTCIAYELPNGDDGARLGRTTHTDLVDDLLALVDHLHLRQTYLFGSSFGSTIALSVLVRWPARFPRCVLQGGFACRPMALWERIAFRLLRYARGPMAGLPLRDRLHPRGEFGIFRRRGQMELWRFLVENSGAVSIAATARRGMMLEQVDLRSRLAEIRQPVLLIGGDDDSIVPAECEQALLDKLPSAARIAIPDCGHYPQYTHAPLVAELVRQFLSPPECLTPGTANCH